MRSRTITALLLTLVVTTCSQAAQPTTPAAAELQQLRTETRTMRAEIAEHKAREALAKARADHQKATEDLARLRTGGAR